jgi:hypothetical protein
MYNHLGSILSGLEGRRNHGTSIAWESVTSEHTRRTGAMHHVADTWKRANLDRLQGTPYKMPVQLFLARFHSLSERLHREAPTTMNRQASHHSAQDVALLAGGIPAASPAVRDVPIATHMCVRRRGSCSAGTGW